MANLIIIDPEGNEQSILLSEGTMRIGRDKENDLMLDDPSVSTFHSEIIFSGSTITLKDLGSTNGTRINGERITESIATDGDLLRFGNVKARLEGDASEFAAQDDLPSAVESAAESLPESAGYEEDDLSAIDSAPARTFEQLPPGKAPGFGPKESEKDSEGTTYLVLAVVVGLAAAAALFLSFTM